MVHYLTFVVLWAIFMNFTLGLDMSEKEMKETKGTFCGKPLSDMLSLVCNGVYNSKQKRNMYNKNEKHSAKGYQVLGALDYSEESFPFRNKQLAKSIFPIEFRKRNQGVATECCHKSCSLWEMSGYCGDSQ